MRLKLFLLVLIALLTGPGFSQTNKHSSEESWGTFNRPFSPDSPWNSRPVNPIFDDYVIPASKYFPAVTAGEWSTGVFSSEASDEPQVIDALPGTPGIYLPDLGKTVTSIVLPHWPRNVSPALESDGHADMVDSSTGIIHSFFKLKHIDNKWYAALYAWSRIDGAGWGDPSHFYQGARATGVPPMAGLIRTTEINDGKPAYAHALAVSLTFNALSADPAYIYPATAADQSAAKTNSGKIPEGALLMLPSDYPVEKIKNDHLRKIAQTLKVYGGYVVDRNVGTPFAIYVEKGSGFNLTPLGWNPQIAEELNQIRLSLRQVKSAEKWLAADGKVAQRSSPMNIMSMRGPWILKSGTQLANYDFYTDSLIFDADASNRVAQVTTNSTISKVTWAVPAEGERYTFQVHASGGATLQLLLTNRAKQRVFESPVMGDLDAVTFTWPNEVGLAYMLVNGPAKNSNGSVRGTLIRK